MARIEVMTRGARRSWSLDQKRDIVAESLGPVVTPTEVTRKHAISSGQLYTWRRELLGAAEAMVQRSVPRFAKVEAPVTAAVRAAVPPTAISCRTEGLIEECTKDVMVLPAALQASFPPVTAVYPRLGIPRSILTVCEGGECGSVHERDNGHELAWAAAA